MLKKRDMGKKEVVAPKKPNIPGIKSKLGAKSSPVADPSLGTLFVGGKRQQPTIPSRATASGSDVRKDALKRRLENKKGIVSQGTIKSGVGS